MMKFFIVLTSLISASAMAEAFKLKEWDHFKLGELLARIPADAKVLNVMPITEPAEGRKERIIFPRWVGAVKIVCENTYFGDSSFISFAACTFEINSQHPDVDVNYDQYKIMLNNPATVQALMSSITEGRDIKEYRSGHLDDGTNFEGRATKIFHYLFKCSLSECDLRVSKKIQE